MAALRVLFVGVLVGGGLFGVGGAAAGGVPERSVRAEADTADTPNRTPYATDRSVAYHILAAPAYVLHGLTRPLGWGIRYVEQRYPGLFEYRLPPRGILPLAELGGPSGVSGGILVYDNALFGSDHAIRIKGLYGARNTFEATAAYRSPGPFGPHTTTHATVNVFSNPRNRFFLGGNAGPRATEGRFERKQLDVTAGLRYQSAEGRWTGHLEALYERVEARRADGERGERLAAARPPGFRASTDLLTARLTLGRDATVGRPRTYWGTDALLQVDYTHDLQGDRFRYGRYVAELRQYLPVGFFPTSRRLALRARLEQVEPLFGGVGVPFYHLPTLGGQNSLRGFVANRFQEEGALLLNAEYRYPVWSTLDAVIFTGAGQVFGALGAVAADRFRWSYGGGLHLLNRSGLSARFEVAGSTEGVRAILTIEPSFQHTAR